MITASLANSAGCTVNDPTPIQRRAPFTSMPTTSTATSMTIVTPMRTGIFFQIGRPSGTSQTLLDASMNALM